MEFGMKQNETKNNRSLILCLMLSYCLIKSFDMQYLEKLSHNV